MGVYWWESSHILLCNVCMCECCDYDYYHHCQYHFYCMYRETSWFRAWLLRFRSIYRTRTKYLISIFINNNNSTYIHSPLTWFSFSFRSSSSSFEFNGKTLVEGRVLNWLVFRICAHRSMLLLVLGVVPAKIALQTCHVYLCVLLYYFSFFRLDFIIIIIITHNQQK